MQPGTSRTRKILMLRESEIILRNTLFKTHGAITKHMVCMQTDPEAPMDPVTAPGWSIIRLIHTLEGRCTQILWLMGLFTTISGRQVRRCFTSSLTNAGSSSNHHGDNTPNITNGFDRTFGPQYYHFNKGGSLEELRKDAEQYGLRSGWNAKFYDSIAKHVPNYVPTLARGTFKAKIDLPKGAKNPIAVLAQSGVDFQDNVFNTKAYQYWMDVKNGEVRIDRVKAGNYRLTIYSEGIFGDYTQDDIVVSAQKTTSVWVKWTPESAGNELWRIGVPDKSSGEYKHGNGQSLNHTLLTDEYRMYWGAYDFVEEFPKGVVFKVGHDDPAAALNYVHWSVFGGKANYKRPKPVYDNVNNWTILFDVEAHQLSKRMVATFTVQLAGAKSAAGNTDVFNATESYSNLVYTVSVNGQDLDPWIIPCVLGGFVEK
jgi:rhamnogalacturonan endolyase